jgi:hypothetical protein
MKEHKVRAAENKEWALRLFFKSCLRLERLSKVKAPKEILASEGKFRQHLLDRLLDFGIDGQKYTESAEGQAEYLAFCVEEEHTDKLFERCRRCLNYFMTDEFDGCSIYKEKMPMKCGRFEDSGTDFDLRVLEAMKRCGECANAKSVKLDEFNTDYDTCSLKLNELNVICDQFIKKTKK